MDRLPTHTLTSYPPRSDEGQNGGAPMRDRRRSRSLGQNVAAAGSAAGVAIGDAQLATWDPRSEDEEAETLSLDMKAYDFAEGAVNGVDVATATDPFSGVDTGGLLPAGVLQNIEVLAQIQWGHDGVSKSVVVSLAPGQIVKAPLGASYVRTRAKLSVKYFPRIALPNSGGIQRFTYLDASPVLRNNIFNALGSPLLTPQANFGAGVIPKTPVHVEACIARGVPSIPGGAATDRASRAVRRFFGTFPVEGGTTPLAGAQVFCPVAFGASSVMLSSSPAPFQFAVGGPTTATLVFGLIDAAGNVTGSLPSNQFFPLNGAREIVVYNPLDTNGAECPFTLVYDMGI